MSRSPKDSLERIVASVPLNQTAAKVTSGGEHYEPVVEFSAHEHFDAPPPIQPMHKLPGTAQGIVGRKCGRLTVIGLAVSQAAEGKTRRKHNARWVVRCVCGDYEFRTVKAIRNPRNTSDRCQRCHHIERVKKRYARLGSRSVEDFRDDAAVQK